MTTTQWRQWGSNPRPLGSRVKHSTTKPLRSHDKQADIIDVGCSLKSINNKQADSIDAFKTTSRYLDVILNLNNVYFDNMVSQLNPSVLIKANTSDTKAAFYRLAFVHF